jgi:hypothetical protein
LLHDGKADIFYCEVTSGYPCAIEGLERGLRVITKDSQGIDSYEGLPGESCRYEAHCNASVCWLTCDAAAGVLCGIIRFLDGKILTSFVRLL